MSRTLAAVTNSYKQFDNDHSELTPSDGQSQSTTPETHRTNGNTSLTLDSTRTYDSTKISTLDVKERSRRKLLMCIQLGVSMFILILECVSTGLSSGSYWGFGARVCHVGTGVWVGLLGILTAILGFLWVRRQDRNAPSKKRYLTAYFVMSLLEAFIDGLLAMLATVCMTQAVAYLTYAKTNQIAYPYLVIKEEHMAVVALNVMMTVLAVIHIVANILATIMICRTWWLSAAHTESPMTFIYVADNLTTARMPTLCIEKGSKVTFLASQTPTTHSGGVSNGEKTH